MPKPPIERSPFRLPSWKAPANRLDWIVMGATAAHWIYSRYKEERFSKHQTTLRFSPEDAPYYWLLRWLEKMPHEQSLSVFKVMASTDGRTDSGPEVAAPSVGRHDRRKPQSVMVPTEGVTFHFRGVRCHIERTDMAAGADKGFQWRRPDMVLRLETRKTDIVIALLEAVSEAGVAQRESPKVYVWQWGWIPVRNCPTKRAAILPAGDYESLTNDLKQFFGSEVWYREVGIPYRRGFLLHGIPGSGKTTTVIALAGDFGLSVCVVNLSAHTDQTLLEGVRAMPANSILLLEDIDCAMTNGRQAPKKDGDKDHLTLSGLLNVIDGAATPEGRVTFMTTNRREDLDPALLRPGRIDTEIKFSHAAVEQIEELAKRFSPTHELEVDAAEWSHEQISMAQVQERLIKKYRRTTEGAAD